ncbi:MAG TPA: PKD domain-containing protein [Bacteroidia bacterium]|jgi:PKD repeat protein
MIKTTKLYIVVFIAFVLAQSSLFAQYNGGNGDGASTDLLSLTSCTNPPSFYAYFGGAGDAASTDQLNQISCTTPATFYAYFGGTGDGANTDMLMNTTCATPAAFFAYMGGTADGASMDQLTLTACATPPSQFFAYMGGNSDGAGINQLNLSPCSTPPSQFYAYFGGSGDGFKVDSLINCPAIPPVANFSASSTSVCVGSAVTFTDLSTNFPSTWAWTFPGGTPGTSSSQNPAITYNTAGVYNVTLTATNANGSNTLTMSSYITVNALPTANAGPNASICNGSSTTLGASGGTSYSWLPATGLSSTSIANPVANPTTSTNYTVTVTSLGCTATDVVLVTVNPIPTANAGSDVAICNGSSSILAASGGGTYSWSPAFSGLSSTVISNPTASPTVTTTYTVTVTVAGCTATDAVLVTVNPIPTANAGSDVTICNGTSTTLSATGGPGYSWSPATGLSSTSIANPVANPLTTTNYTVTVTNGTGCTATDIVIVTVTPLPSANAGTDVSICNSSSTTLGASGGTSYSWLPATGLSSTSIANPVANPTTSTNYTVTVTSLGCTATDVVLVTVNPIPTANAGSDVAICNGSSSILAASGGGTYSWSPAFSGLSSTVISNPTASPTVTTTYTVTVTVAGCTATDAVLVTVNPIPTANAGTDVTICNGTSTTLSATGGLGYSWSPATGLSSTSIANPVANPLTTTNYTVTVTNGTGCTATDIVIVTVTPLPSANAGTDVSICNGASTTLGASGGTSYSWLPATGLSSTSIANPVANPTTSTNYTVTVTSLGCTATDVVVVTVTPGITANAGSDVAICNGASTLLGASGGTSYNWSPASGLNFSNISNPTASPTVTTTYTVTVTAGGCTATDVVVVTVNPIPTASVSAGGPTTFCADDSVILTSSAGSSYLWSTGAITASITVLNSGSYSVTLTNASGCSATSAATAVTVNPLGTASITPSGATTFCQGGSVTLTANLGSGYSWSTSASTQSITVSLAGTYTVSVSDINGCFSAIASVSITVNPNPSVPVIAANGSTSLCIGDTVILSSTLANSYLWSNGSTDSAIYVSAAGTYSVTIYNSFGCGTSSSASTVNVNVPLADFTGTPLLVFIPTANVNFSATTSGVPPYTYLWNFGDATTSTLAAPAHTYGTVAYETVSLTVTDSTGCSQTITKPNYVEVEQLFPSWAMVTGTTVDLTGVSFIDAQTGIMSLTDGNCVISADSGNTWSPLPTGNIEPLTGACIIPGNWFVTGENGTILLSTNNGTSWNSFVTGTTETFNGSHFTSPLNGFAVGTTGTIQRYNGSTWAPESSGTVERLNNVFAFSATDATAVGDNQTILRYNGVSWLPQTAPVSFDVKDIRFSTALEGYAAGTNGVIIKTTDGGTTWTPSLTGVDIAFNSIEVSGTDSAWAAGTNGIVYTTVDDGTTWIRYSVGYTATQDELRVRGGKGHVTGQGGNGRNFGNGAGLITGKPDATEQAINSFNVYPNPAQELFTISGLLSNPENLHIEIKDANGKLVELIMNSTITGQFTTTINTEHFANGIYFIHIIQGERSWVQKLVLAK